MRLLTLFSSRKIFQCVALWINRIFIKKKNIVFYCGSQFHIPHIQPVLERIESNCYLVCAGGFDENILSRVTCIEGDLIDLPKWIAVDVLISTEVMELPYYFCGISIYFGHGIGPKMNYQLDNRIQSFDYIYSPCRYFHDEFSRLYAPEKVRAVGLPILDGKMSPHKSNIILYAPSWCTNKCYISDIQEIIESLARLKGYRIIVSLHPNLIQDMNSGALQWLHCYPNSCWSNVEYIHDTEFASSFDVLRSASAVVGDISSIIFEALAFNIPIIFDGNTAIYHFCHAALVLPKVECCFYTLAEVVESENVKMLLHQDPKKSEREKFANSYLINQNAATDTFLHELKSIG